MCRYLEASSVVLTVGGQGVSQCLYPLLGVPCGLQVRRQGIMEETIK